ncbi:hypothetical protein JCM24511_09935 [Saitozyma sp. JCM 24511]|nr:hypothetical protein JCM24511_09935 [Saitozyma sp. JCM 24511]
MSPLIAQAAVVAALASVVAASPTPLGAGVGAGAGTAQHLVSRDTLSGLCTTSHLSPLVSAFTDISTVTYHTASITANVVSNHTTAANAGGPMWRTVTGVEFCNVTLTMSHDNLNDTILLNYWLPDPGSYKNRWLTLGGGGWSVDGSGSLDAGPAYGAASGATDGGFGGAGSQLSATLLSKVNGTIEWSRLESFAYQAIHEMTVTGKELARGFYNISADQLKSYYLGCSEGGREGHMSTQRFPDDFDGVVAAAPAFYFPVHQLAQGWPNIAMAQHSHWPSTCAFQTIQKALIAECDPLDGLKDGVISRSDLCKFDASSSVGKTFTNCSSTAGAPTSGTISQADADVYNAIHHGAFDSNGDQIFWTYRNGTTLTVEASVKWDNDTQSWGPDQSHFFNTYYQNLVLKNTVAPTLNYSDFTVDQVYDLMLQGIQDYGSWTETTWPDLSQFQARGGKLVHWHGEQDTNLYPEASAHFYEKVKKAMFPGSSGYDQLQEFYRFFLVPGAAHCAISSAEPHGPFPQNALQQVIAWVENGTAPDHLDGTTESGSSTQSQICMWPTRPSWDSDGNFCCVDDGHTPEEFIHPLNGWKVDY